MALIFPLHRVESIMCGHYRLSQDTDNQTKVFVVVSKRKEEVREVSALDRDNLMWKVICIFSIPVIT